MNSETHRHDITMDEGDKRIKMFLEIRDEIREKVLKSSVGESLSEATKQYLKSSILSFAFEKSHLDTLAQANDATALRFYFAATPPHGTPTAVIYACKIVPGNSFTVSNQTSSGGGSQHPYLQPMPPTQSNFSGATDASKTVNEDESGEEQ